jgi:hypothetical protein
MPAKSKKPAARNGKSSKAAGSFPDVFAALKNLLKPHQKHLSVNADKPAYYAVDMRAVLYRGKPLYFAGVRLGGGYVSYYLMPVYGNPALQKQMSPELKKRMQGKACFNFTAVDPVLFGQLAQLAAAGLECFKSPDFSAMRCT